MVGTDQKPTSRHSALIADSQPVAPEERNRPRIIRLIGEIDLDGIRALRVTLSNALDVSDDVRLDLSELRVLDSFAIREFLRAQALAALAGKTFGIGCATPTVRRLLDAADAKGLLLSHRDPGNGA